MGQRGSGLLGPPAVAHSDTLITTSQSGGMAVHVSDRFRRNGDDSGVLERVAVFTAAGFDAARSRAEAWRARGINAMYREHRAAWARRWRDADIVIGGDEELQRNVRYSLFQLMGAVGTRGEAALGARGLSGDGYNGHVFWDSDVFVVPFLAATCPSAARAMLEYRVRRIGTAVEQARELGRAGAKFPWESASTGARSPPRWWWARAARRSSCAPARWRTTSWPTWPGQPAGTTTGPLTSPSAAVRSRDCWLRPPAIGHRASNVTAMARRTSATSSAPTSTTTTSMTTRSPM